jgi:hypothetical protein
MKSKRILLGNSTAVSILDNNCKREILKYLFSFINLYSYRFTILNTLSKIKFLENNEHYVIPNYYGTSFLMLFMKLDGEEKCFLLDRRKLKYNYNDIIIEDVICLQIEVKCNKTLYEGTIFDGKFLKGDKSTFLINDCFYLTGNSMLSIDIQEKVKAIDNILCTYFSSSPCNNFTIKYSKIYTYYDLDDLINNKLNTMEHNVIGLNFIPKKSGVFFIFRNNVESKVEITSTIKEENETYLDCPSYDLIRDLDKMLKARKYSYENNKTKNYTVEKTETPDVYRLYEMNTNNMMDIAIIPNMKVSHMCNEIFKNKEKTNMRCTYFTRFKKWMPTVEI